MALPLPRLPWSERASRRFEVSITHGSENECWEWNALRTHQGYGRFSYKRVMYPAHRIAYYLHTGEDPGELDVCHTCDNPPCCNPSHLFAGTRRDNAHDMLRKGRNRCGVGETHGSRTHPEKWYRGEQKPEAKLTEAQVREIRRSYAAGTSTHQALADHYGVTREAVSSITQGKAWSHIASEDGLGCISDPLRRGKKGEMNKDAKLNAGAVREIRRLYRDGAYTYRTLAERFNVSPGAIAFIIRRRTWAHVAD